VLPYTYTALQRPDTAAGEAARRALVFANAMNGAPASTWDGGLGGTKGVHLVDDRGAAWMQGIVSPGVYTLRVERGDGAVDMSDVTIRSGLNYGFSRSTRALYEARRIPGDNVCKLASAAQESFLEATPTGTVANGRVVEHHGAVVVGDGTVTKLRFDSGKVTDLATCFSEGYYLEPPRLYLLERLHDPPLVLAVGRNSAGETRVRTFVSRW
jgi:hypothetical protein